MGSRLKIGAITLNDHQAACGRIELSALVGEDEGWETEITFRVPFRLTSETTIESLRQRGIDAVAQLLRDDVFDSLEDKVTGSKGHLKFVDGPLKHTIGTVIQWKGAGQPPRPFVNCEGHFYQVVNWTGAATEDAATMDEYTFAQSHEHCYDALGCNFQLNGRHQKGQPGAAGKMLERFGGSQH